MSERAAEAGRPRFEALGFVALAIGLLAILFKDAVLHGWVLGQGDLLFEFEPWRSHAPGGWRAPKPANPDVPTVFYPFLAYARDAITAGRFPLWSASIYGGHPFFASFQSALLSPFTAIAYLVPMPYATNAVAASRLLAGGVGMYVFLRSLGLASAAAFFGGAAYLLNPFAVVWLEHPHSAAAAWGPWLLAAIEHAVMHRRLRSAAWIAVATALLLLSGHPETAFKIFLLGGAYALLRASSLSVRSAARVLAIALLGVTLGALASLVQLLPFYEYVRQSRVLADRSTWTTPQFVNPGISFVTAFVPDFFGHAAGRFVLPYSNYFEQQIYPGIATWILAAAALATKRCRGIVWFCAAAAAVSAPIMYGTFMTRIAATLLPPLRVAAVSRFGTVVIVCLVIMAAIGVDEILAVRRDRPALRTRALLATAASVVIALVVIVFLRAQHSLLASGRLVAATEQAAMKAGFLATVTVGLIWLAAHLPRQAVGAALVGVIGIDLLAFGAGLHPMSPASHVFPPLPEVDVIRADKELFRVAGWNDVLLPNTSLVYGVHDYRGYDGIGLARYLDFLDVGFRNNGAYHALVHVATPHLLDLLNVKYVIAPADIAMPAERFTPITDGAVRVYRNDRVQPRAFLVDEVVTLQGDDARRALRRGAIDFRRVAILDADLPEAERPERGSISRATVTHYEDERCVVETEAEGHRLLVLSDVFYPGWEARIDGAPVTIRRANYAFRAVPVPAGRHIVTFEYAPRSFRWGLYASLAGLIALAALFLA